VCSFLEEIASGSASKSTELFASELLQSPGFVEFDEVNQKVLTFCAEARQYKVWSMAEPSKVLYHITDSRIDEIKISPGIMLLVLAKTQNYVRTAPETMPPMRPQDASHAQGIAFAAASAWLWTLDA
jgi:hypothetical protein